LFDGKGLVTLRLHRRRADGADGAELGTTISLGPAIYTDVYRAHPNPDVDIALINVSGVFAGIEGLYHRNIGRSMWADFADDRLIPALEIIFVGYPFGLYDQKNNLPILRAGRIASHPRADFDGKPEYIIDAQVFPGSSGSPVFVALGGEFKFAGVVGKTHFQDEQLGTVPAALAQTYRQYVGLGVVYKPEAVTDLLKSMAREFLSCAP
jgi:hypothetical protein